MCILGLYPLGLQMSFVELKDAIDSLPLGLYALCDAAYMLLEKVLVPSIGADQRHPVKDAFNYYLSQV